jgi:hypothetical protein
VWDSVLKIRLRLSWKFIACPCYKLEWTSWPIFQNHETSCASFKLLKMVTTVINCRENQHLLPPQCVFQSPASNTFPEEEDNLNYSLSILLFYRLFLVEVSCSIYIRFEDTSLCLFWKKNKKISLDGMEDLHFSDTRQID